MDSIRKIWLLQCTVNGSDIDHEEMLYSSQKPSDETCRQIATRHGCKAYHVQETSEYCN